MTPQNYWNNFEMFQHKRVMMLAFSWTAQYSIPYRFLFFLMKELIT